MGGTPYRNDYGDFFGRVLFSVTLGGTPPPQRNVVVTGGYRVMPNVCLRVSQFFAYLNIFEKANFKLEQAISKYFSKTNYS